MVNCTETHTPLFQWQQALSPLQSLDWLQVISFLGILITIAISYSALNQQRRAGMRESLEQLDAVKLGGPNAKVKPLLHTYSKWPRNQTEVKLKVYRPTEVADMSNVDPRFLVLPGQIFHGFDVRAVRDGYILTIASSDPVEIRQAADKLLQRMTEEGRFRDNTTWITFEEFQRNYQESLAGQTPQIHKDILEFLKKGARTEEDIKQHLSEKSEYKNQLITLAIRDLLLQETIESIDDSSRYRIIDSANRRSS